MTTHPTPTLISQYASGGDGVDTLYGGADGKVQKVAIGERTCCIVS